MGITAGFVWLPLKEVMHKGILRLAVVLIAALLNMGAAQASYYSGVYLGGKFGINNSTATGTIYDPGASTFAYGVQGGYLQGGYNWDVRTAIVGVGAYADFNSNEIHANKMEYGSRAFGLDAKLGVPVDEWLLYTKVGYGYSAGTNDLRAVSQYSSNVAVGLEYNFVFAFRWGAIVEYKLDNFSSKDGSISINNKTLAFGLNYYFDRPEVAPVAKVAEVELEPEPLPEADPGLEEEPPPDIGSGGYSIADADSTQDPESWKILLAGKAVRIEGANFISGTASLMSVVSKELDETAGFAAKYPYAKLEVNGYSDDPAKQNLQLSLGRAEAIKKYLVTKGVAAKRISVKNKGPADPIGDNKTEEGRAKNRRIEIFSVIKAWKTLLENKPVIIENTNFVPGTAKLKPDVGIELDAVAGFAGKYPDAKLEMIGYSDTTNPAMSLELADSVRNYLVTKGVADTRITIKGEGSAKPVGDNQTKAGRAKNRRVEIHSVSKDENKERVAAPAPAPAPAPPSKSAPTPAPATTLATATAIATAPAAKLASTPAQTSVPVSWKILLEAKPVLINIEGTSFVSGSGIPNARIGRNLDEVVGFAGKYPETKFELTGYADSRGPEKKNLELSLTRAESVKAYLVKKGVAADRITARGEGSANPVGDNQTKQGRAKNRRVEIHSVNKEENKGLVAAPVPVPVTAPATATAPAPASAPVPAPQSAPEADSWKAFWPPNERRGR